MKLKTLFIINAVVCMVFGLSFVLMPGTTIAMYGDESMGGQFKYVAQLLGATLLPFGAIGWFARNSDQSKARDAIVLSMTIGNTIGFLVALINQFGGAVNALNWSTVVIYLLFALGFGYFQFFKPSGS